MMGWGIKAIEIWTVENLQFDGVFMHNRTQKLRFLCERNDKVDCGGGWIVCGVVMGGRWLFGGWWRVGTR